MDVYFPIEWFKCQNYQTKDRSKTGETQNPECQNPDMCAPASLQN